MALPIKEQRFVSHAQNILYADLASILDPFGERCAIPPRLFPFWASDSITCAGPSASGPPRPFAHPRGRPSVVIYYGRCNEYRLERSSQALCVEALA